MRQSGGMEQGLGLLNSFQFLNFSIQTYGREKKRMNGFITKAALAARRGTAVTAVALFAAAGSGCVGYRDIVDPCYPERYAYAARKEVHEIFATQVQNGHVLDQTIWNWMFYPGTDRLHPAGMEHLTYLVQRRPAPDSVVFLATAHDIAYDEKAPEKYVEARADLDKRRIRSIDKYLTAQSAGRQMTFKVEVHDPAETQLPGPGIMNAPVRWYGTFTGTMGGVGPTTTTGTAGGLGLSGNIQGPGTSAGGR